MLAAGERMGAIFTPKAAAQVRQGFPDSGDDGFDAMVGLLGLLAVVTGQRSEQMPETTAVRQVEGWILGRRPSDIGRT